MFLNLKYIFAVLILIQLQVIAQNGQSPSSELFKQAEKLIEKQDFEKAKLTLKLFQKYEEKKPKSWLNAQVLIIRSEIELGNFNIAKNLIKIAKDKIVKETIPLAEIEKDILFLEAEIFEIENQFTKAEAIYRKLLKKANSPDIQIKLANNLIDRVLSSHTKQAQKDYEELRTLVSSYEKNNGRNPLELIRIKQKVNSYQMVNKETLSNLEKLETYWLKKDEYTIFRIYLNNVLRNYEQSYKVWLENKAIVSLRSHPLTVPVLISLSRHFLQKNLKRSKEINSSLSLLVRDSKEKNLVDLLSIEILLLEKKAAEAYSVYENSIKNNPDSPKRSEMEIILAEAYLEQKEFKICRSLLKAVSDKKIINPELKSRKLFIDASLLQASGKEKDAAVLFLRVGQTATNAQTALKSLFMAGKAFYSAQQCNRAIIAFKILLEKKRNQFTDETLYYLSLSHAQCKDYPKALSTIDQLILTGKNPQLKKKALFEKGDYWVMSGNTSKAIEAYNDYTVVYTKDSRNPAIWYKIYKIHLSQKKLPESEKILTKIIKNSSNDSPDVYSAALHQKALMHQLRGEDRESITLWQKYLEFNQKVETKAKDEVKLMLAAAYQNSESLNLTASVTIYEDVFLKTKDSQIREISLRNLLSISSTEPQAYLETLKKLLTSKEKLSAEVINLLCEQTVKIKDLRKENEAFISKISKQDLKLYWTAKALSSQNEKQAAIKALELLKSVNKDSFKLKKLALQRMLYTISGDDNSALNASLQIIYQLTAKEVWSQTSELSEIDQSALSAIKILTETGKRGQAEKVLSRIQKAKLPLSKETLLKIEGILKVKK